MRIRNFVIGAAMLAAACSKSKSDNGAALIGAWTIDVAATTTAMQADSKSQIQVTASPEYKELFEKQWKDEISKHVSGDYTGAKLDVTQDGKYTLHWTLKGSAMDEAGTWHAAATGPGVVLTCATVNGKTDQLPQDKTLAPAATGATLDDPEYAYTKKIKLLGGAVQLVRATP